MLARKLGALFLALAVVGVGERASGGESARAKAEKAVKDGDTSLILGDLPGARKSYGEAIKHDPSFALGTIRLAWVEGQAGNDVEAVRLLEELTSKGGNFPTEAWQILAGALARRRELARAADAYEKYLSKEKDDLQARLELARVLRSLAEEGKSDFKDRALAEYETVMKAAAGDEAMFRQAEEESFGLRYGAAGKAFREGKDAFVQGDARGAATKLEGVVKQHPEIQEAQYLLGMAYIAPEINRRADALRAWEKAPTIKEARLHLGIELHNDGDLKSAQAHLEKAIELNEDYQEAWYHLGTIHAERGDESAAVAAWRRAMEIDPGNETGKWARTKVGLMTAQTTGDFQEGQIIDPALETELGQKFADQVLKEWPEVKDAKLVARMEKIFENLIDATQRDDIQYHLYVVDAQMWGTPLVNAFAFPGGRIFITKALIDGIKLRFGDRDDYYAAILAHELAHAALRHVPERWKFMQTVINSGDVSAGDLYGLIGNLGTGMTRQSEHEADRYGTLYMYRSGYDPKYMLDFWHNASRVLPDTPPGSDHATHGERAARTRDFLIEMRGRVAEFERGNKAFKEEDYATASRHYEVYLALLPKSAPGHMNLGLARHRQALARLGTGQKYKRTTDLDPDSKAAPIEVHATDGDRKPDPRIDRRLMKQAAAEYKTALRLDPTYALARVNYGALLLDLGQHKVARKVLEAAVKQKGATTAGAWNNLGVAYLLSANRKKALEAFDKAIKLDAKLPDPWFNLGVIHADLGDTEKAIAAFDEYTKRDAGSGWAKAARAKKAELANKPKKPNK